MYLPERRREGRLSLRGWVDGGRGTLGGRDAGLLGPGRRGLLQGDHGAFINRKMVEIPTNNHVYWYYSTQSERHWLTNDQWFHQSLSTLWHCPHVLPWCSLLIFAVWGVPQPGQSAGDRGARRHHGPGWPPGRGWGRLPASVKNTLRPVTIH